MHRSLGHNWDARLDKPRDSGQGDNFRSYFESEFIVFIWLTKLRHFFEIVVGHSFKICVDSGYLPILATLTTYSLIFNQI